MQTRGAGAGCSQRPGHQAAEFVDQARLVDRRAAKALQPAAAEYGYDMWDAYMMLSQCGLVRLGNFVDPKYTVGAGIEKKYLAP